MRARIDSHVSSRVTGRLESPRRPQLASEEGRIIVRPLLAPATEVDVTDAVVTAIAHQLAQRCGGNEVLNWLEAECFVRESLC